jgi:hypothetical protein
MLGTRSAVILGRGPTYPPPPPNNNNNNNNNNNDGDDEDNTAEVSLPSL